MNPEQPIVRDADRSLGHYTGDPRVTVMSPRYVRAGEHRLGLVDTAYGLRWMIWRGHNEVGPYLDSLTDALHWVLGLPAIDGIVYDALPANAIGWQHIGRLVRGSGRDHGGAGGFVGTLRSITTEADLITIGVLLGHHITDWTLGPNEELHVERK